MSDHPTLAAQVAAAQAEAVQAEAVRAEAAPAEASLTAQAEAARAEAAETEVPPQAEVPSQAEVQVEVEGETQVGGAPGLAEVVNAAREEALAAEKAAEAGEEPEAGSPGRWEEEPYDGYDEAGRQPTEVDGSEQAAEQSVGEAAEKSVGEGKEEEEVEELEELGESGEPSPVHTSECPKEGKESKARFFYFGKTGRLLPIILTMEYGRVPYELVTIGMEEWPKYKPYAPEGMMPFMALENRLIPESFTLLLHAASRANMLPSTPEGMMTARSLHEDLDKALEAAARAVFGPPELKEEGQKKAASLLLACEHRLSVLNPLRSRPRYALVSGRCFVDCSVASVYKQLVSDTTSPLRLRCIKPRQLRRMKKIHDRLFQHANLANVDTLEPLDTPVHMEPEELASYLTGGLPYPGEDDVEANLDEDAAAQDPQEGGSPMAPGDESDNELTSEMGARSVELYFPPTHIQGGQGDCLMRAVAELVLSDPRPTKKTVERHSVETAEQWQALAERSGLIPNRPVYFSLDGKTFEGLLPAIAYAEAAINARQQRPNTQRTDPEPATLNAVMHHLIAAYCEYLNTKETDVPEGISKEVMYVEKRLSEAQDFEIASLPVPVLLIIVRVLASRIGVEATNIPFISLVADSVGAGVYNLEHIQDMLTPQEEPAVADIIASAREEAEAAEAAAAEAAAEEPTLADEIAKAREEAAAAEAAAAEAAAAAEEPTLADQVAKAREEAEAAEAREQVVPEQEAGEGTLAEQVAAAREEAGRDELQSLSSGRSSVGGKPTLAEQVNAAREAAQAGEAAEEAAEEAREREVEVEVMHTQEAAGGNGTLAQSIAAARAQAQHEEDLAVEDSDSQSAHSVRGRLVVQQSPVETATPTSTQAPQQNYDTIAPPPAAGVLA